MTITILGQTPSQKNSKEVGRNRTTGRTFVASNKRVKSWQESALAQLDLLDLKFRGRPLRLDYTFYVKDNVQRDLDNMIASVNDILQLGGADKATVLSKAGKPREKRVRGTGIITGDHWQVLKIGSADAMIDKESPRAVITITEL